MNKIPCGAWLPGNRPAPGPLTFSSAVGGPLADPECDCGPLDLIGRELAGRIGIYCSPTQCARRVLDVMSAEAREVVRRGTR